MTGKKTNGTTNNHSAKTKRTKISSMTQYCSNVSRNESPEEIVGSVGCNVGSIYSFEEKHAKYLVDQADKFVRFWGRLNLK